MSENLYDKNGEAVQRVFRDTFSEGQGNRFCYNAFLDSAIRYIQDFQLMREDLWSRFVRQFREDADYDNGWRGEYWGKMMRGACLTYAYTREKELYRILTGTVSDMMDSQEEDGRISSYGVDHELEGWDLWCRKYVLLGMQYYLEICEDPEFARRVLVCMCRQADAIIALVGRKEEGKRPITTCSGNWRGLNASSILEPIVRLYRLSGEKRYLDFAAYIVECGGTHELFDYSTVRQANTTNGEISQETCVTVTMMKFFYQLLLLTGDPRYADAFEISMYNAYLGAINTEKAVNPKILEEHPDWKQEPLPFDSYSPLTAGVRGMAVGGLQVMSDLHYYGCCACIGSAGGGLIPRVQLTGTREGFALNLFIDGTVRSRTPSGGSIRFEIRTDYPRSGQVKIILGLEQNERFELRLRNPAWSRATQVEVNGENIPAQAGYTVLKQEWHEGDMIELELDMRTEAVRPVAYGHDILMNKVVWEYDYQVPVYDREDPAASEHLALRRGPVMLARENRLEHSVDEPADILVDQDGYVDVSIPLEDTAPYPHIVEAHVPLEGEIT